MRDVLARLQRKPALIGHSFGGLILQILAGRGLGSVTVAIDPDRHPREPRPLGYAFRKASKSALMVSASVVGIPCGKPLYVFNVLFRSNFADNGPESAYGTIWSSSPCITRTGTLIFFRSSVKSVCEKATMPSKCALAPPIMPWRHQFRITP